MKEPRKVPVRTRLIASAVVLAIGALVAWTLLRPQPTTLRYEQFLAKVESSQVRSVTINSADGSVDAKLRDGKHIAATVPPDAVDRLTRSLAADNAKVDVKTSRSSLVSDLLTSFIPTLLIIGVFLWFVSQMQGTGGRSGKFSRVRAQGAGAAGAVTFADVAGADEAVEELREVTEFLTSPDRFTRLGAKPPRGVLLYGPPGTGKTLLAKAVAGEAGAPFLSISGSDFVEMFVGVGASRVRDLFRQAKEQAPAIIFVDEIDAVGRHRGAGVGGGHDEREQTLNQLLVEMDGFAADSGVILMAATNRPDILDPALLRPGRFDRQVMVEAPDRRGRREILDVHARGRRLGSSVDLDVLAGRTPGFTGADLANVINEGAILAARRGGDTIEVADLGEAVDRVISGPQKARAMSDEEKRVVAVHEAGHAVVGHVVGTDPVHRVSIVSRGRALGQTMSLPAEDRYLQTRAQLRGTMAMMLGGRAAEELVVGEITTGAADDIERVSETARRMVTQFGMSGRLGPRKLGHTDGEPFLGRDGMHQADYSPDMAAEVDTEIKALIDEAHDTALAVLDEHRDRLNALVDHLLAEETAEEADLARLFDGLPRRSALGVGD